MVSTPSGHFHCAVELKVSTVVVGATYLRINIPEPPVPPGIFTGEGP
jgi:hypothetical protein